MEINKLKRLLAEGNPEKQLENIIENLSEGSEIPFDRQINRVDAKEGIEEETAAKLKQLQMQASQYGKDIPPAIVQEIRKLEGLLKNREAQTNIARSFVKETIKDKRDNQKDALTGEKLREGVDKMKLNTIKFGNRVETTPELNEEKIIDNKEESLMNKEQKAIFEQSMDEIFKILKEEDEEMTEEELAVGEVPAVESPEVELPVEEEVVEVEPGQEEVQAEEPVLEPELQANDAELAGVEPAEEVIEVEEVAPEAEEAVEEVQPEIEEEMPSEEEVVEVDTSVEPQISITDASIKIEIPIAGQESVVDEVIPEEAEALQEAFRTVYRTFVPKNLSEEESVEVPLDAEAEVRIEDGSLVIEIPIENPIDEITQEEADALQEAVAVISYLLKEEIEVSKPEEQQYKVEEEIAPSDASEPVVKTEIESGEVVVQDHDHADEEGQEVRDALHEEEELEVSEESSEEEQPEVEESEAEEEVETIEIPENVEADVIVSDNKIRIELPTSREELPEELSSPEAIQEAFKFIYSLFKSSNLNEAEEVEVPADAEADVKIEGDKLVIEIDVENPAEEIGEEEAEALQETIDYLNYFLNEEDRRSTVGKATKGLVVPGAVAGAAAGGSAVGANIIRNQWLTAADAIRKTLPSPTAVGGQTAWNNLFQAELARAGLASSADAAVKTGLAGLVQTGNAAATAGLELGKSALAAGSAALASASPALIAAAAGVPIGLAALWVAKGGIPRFVQKKLGMGKTGKLYKQSKSEYEDVANQELSIANQEKKNARIDYIRAKEQGKQNVKDASRGLTLGSRVLSKIPLLNKLGNLKMFQNKDIQDKMASDKEKISTALTTAGTPENDLLTSKGLKYDPNKGTISYDNARWMDIDQRLKAGTITADKAQAEKQDMAAARIKLLNSLAKTGDYAAAVDGIRADREAAKQQAAKDLRLARDAERQAVRDANLKINTNKAILKDKDADEAMYQAAKADAKLMEDFTFDFDRAYDYLEETPFNDEEKLDIIAEAYALSYYVELRESVEESGYNLTDKGLSLFLESKGVDIEQSEKEEIMKSLNSEKVKSDFEQYYQSKRHLDIKSDEITNKDMETGMKAEDVKPVIVESEDLGSKAAKPVHGSGEAKEHTPELENSDVFPAEEHQQAEEVEAVIVESEHESHSEKVNHAGSDTIDSDGQLAEDKEDSEEKHEEQAKAEPKDVTEAVQYKSLKEAFLLENGYFEKDSVTVVSPADKKSKLLNQLGLLVARDVHDPLYEELLKTTAYAKQLQEELQAKYKAVALKKADQLLESKSKKSDESQASSLEFMTALYEQTLQEGFGEWAKGKVLMMVVGLLPESKLDELIMKAKTRALQMGKSQVEKMEIGRLFKQATGSRAEKIKFIKKLIKEAPESQQANADEKLSKLVMGLKDKTEKEQKEGKPLQESIQLAINEGFWAAVGQAILASSPLSMVVGVLGGLVIAGIINLVTRLIDKLTKDQYESKY